MGLLIIRIKEQMFFGSTLKRTCEFFFYYILTTMNCGVNLSNNMALMNKKMDLRMTLCFSRLP